MAEYAYYPRDHGNEAYKYPLGTFTSLNKHVNFVNPVRDALQLLEDMSVSLFQRGKPFRDRLHDAYARVPPPWV